MITVLGAPAAALAAWVVQTTVRDVDLDRYPNRAEAYALAQLNGWL